MVVPPDVVVDIMVADTAVMMVVIIFVLIFALSLYVLRHLQFTTLSIIAHLRPMYVHLLHVHTLCMYVQHHVLIAHQPIIRVLRHVRSIVPVHTAANLNYRIPIICGYLV
jgi:hypothetical protein